MKHCCRFFLVTVLLFSLISCHASAQTAGVLLAMVDSQSDLPAGQIYRKGASVGDEGYADEELLAVLYGDGLLPPEFDVINDFAIRLSSFAEPYELAVFYCVSERDAYDVARMCLKRTQHLAVSCRETEFADMVDTAQVSIRGKYVLIAICSDPQNAIEAGRRASR